MPVAFLAPVFLAGLAAIAVPVLIHLANRPKKQVVPFPSLMFLERVEYRASSRRALRDVLLLVLRVLALVLVAAAFARPFLARPDAPAVALEGQRELVVLLDRSASMAAGDRMDRARAAVAGAAGSLRRGDRATLVVFDHAAAAANRATDRPETLTAAADTVRPGPGGTRFAPALRLAESLLSGSPLPRRELVVVSDFQRAGWDAEAAPRMPDGTVIRTVPVGGPVDNAAVTDVQVARERFSGRDRVRLRARVVNEGADAFDEAVTLEVGGRPLASAPLSVEAGGEATVELGPITLGDRPTAITVRAGRDALPLDNEYRLVLEPGRAYRVLVVEPGGGRAGAYLARALEVGGAHDVARVRADRLAAGALAGVDVVFLDGADPVGDAQARALRTFVEAGRGLVAVLGERSRPGRWDGAAAGLLPGTIGGTRDRGDDGAALASLRYDHPLLRPFREAPAGLTGSRAYRYRELDPAQDADVLARFDDGAPAVVAGRAGAGRVVALTAPLDGRWSDLVLQPAFVPLVHGLVRHAAGRTSAPRARTVGDLLDAGAPGAATRASGRGTGAVPGAGGPRAGATADGGSGAGASAPVGGAAATSAPTERSAEAGGSGAVLVTPSGRRLPVVPGVPHRLDEAGFYEIREARAASAAPPIAVNPDPTESLLEAVDPGLVQAAIAGGPGTGPGVSFAREDRERHQALWWYALAAAFLIMVTETALSNRLSRRPLPMEGRT